MTLNLIKINNSANYKDNIEIKSGNAENIVKTDYERMQQADSFVNNDISTAQKIEQRNQSGAATENNKNHRVRNFVVDAVVISLLFYGGLVLKHKLSKPTFEEIQNAFKEIFGKDLSKEEVNALLDKYKKLLKSSNKQDFAQQIIEQLKKDYGIEGVSTTVNAELLKDGKIKTAIEHIKLGEASPLSNMNILPPKNDKYIVKDELEEIFGTGFHKIKHLKQFADAYRANPDKFVDAIYERSVKRDVVEECIEEIKAEFKKEAELLQKDKDFKGMTLNQIEKLLNEQILNEGKGSYENFVAAEIKKSFKKMLDERFGSLEPYKEGSEEYKKGMEYIDAYAEYPNSSKDCAMYRDNLLEKEAWNNGDLSKKIYNYLKSIWTV